MIECQVYRILIASPSDVNRERNAVRDTILKWNHQHTEGIRVILLPILWEEAAAGDTRLNTQQAINRQLVARCDLCIGVFWTRIGTPTDTHPGGAVEEIHRMIQEERPTTVYFREKQPPKNHDPKQLAALQMFEKELDQRGFNHRFKTTAELVDGVLRDISVHIHELRKKPRTEDSGIVGEWIEIKKSTARRPYALVRIERDKKNGYKVRGKSFSKLGKVDVRWPAGKLDVSIGLKNQLVHCFDARQGISDIVGLTSYEFDLDPEGNSVGGRGFYAHQSEGGEADSRRVEFELVKATKGLLRRFILRDTLRDEKDEGNLIRKLHRDLLQKRVVITGGAYSGKTTLIEALKVAGHRTIPESAIQVIQQLTKDMGTGSFKTWRKQKPTEFQSCILEKQLAIEGSFEPGNDEVRVFMDRSAIDCIAYLLADDLQVPPEFVEYARNMRLEHVFLLETLVPFKPRKETGRQSTLAFSRRIHDLLYRTYVEFGWTPVRIEQLPVETRVQKILDVIS